LFLRSSIDSARDSGRRVAVLKMAERGVPVGIDDGGSIDEDFLASHD
jgi:hypothetical protein